MPENTIHRKLLIIAIFVGLCYVLFGHLHVVELRAEEPRRAIVAMEMEITGQYLVPKINGWNYYNKPPLFNWLLVVFFKIFGSYDTWVVRLPSLVSFLLCGLANYLFVKRYLTKETAIISTLFFFTAGDLLFYGTQVSGEIDLFFTLLVCLQVMLMYHYFRQNKILCMFVISYALTAAGVLTKGPPAILFEGITLLVILWYYKRWRLLFQWQHVAGIFTFIAITGSYFYVYSLHEDVLPYMINLFKEASQKSGLENQSPKLLISTVSYPFLLLQWLLPWSLFAVYFLSKKTISEIRGQEFLSFAALFILANIPVYWLTGNPKSRYIYMFFPFFMLLLADAYEQRKQDWPKITKGIHFLFSFTVIALPLAALILPWINLKVPVQGNYLKAFLILMPAAIVAWLYWKHKALRLYYFILSLILVRLAINFFYLPSLRVATNAILNLEHVHKIRSISGDAPVFLAGQPFTQENNLDFGPLHIAKSEIVTAPMLSYIIPYYYTRETGHILAFEEKMRPERWYIINSYDIGSVPVDTFYTFEDPWTKHKMLMVRLK